jgi:hypothetical protein
MPMSPVWYEIQQMVKDWYGMELPIRILSREDQIQDFEDENAGLFPHWCWDYVSKNTHLMLLWMNPHICVDLIVRWDGALRFVQDIEFRSRYATPETWHYSIKKLLDNSDEVWVVFHED